MIFQSVPTSIDVLLSPTTAVASGPNPNTLTSANHNMGFNCIARVLSQALQNPKGGIVPLQEMFVIFRLSGGLLSIYLLNTLGTTIVFLAGADFLGTAGCGNLSSGGTSR